MAETDKARASRMMRTYGITLEQYDELFTKQDGRCPICLRSSEEFTTRLAVDHDHKTGEVRGLLCACCNHRIVGRHRDADLLQRVADYLRGGTGWYVPPKKKKTRRRKTPRKGTKIERAIRASRVVRSARRDDGTPVPDTVRQSDGECPVPGDTG